MIQQNVHEAVIRDHLQKFGCAVELGMELVGFEQREDDVIAQVRRHCEDGEMHEETIRASYVVGADGARGTFVVPKAFCPDSDVDISNVHKCLSILSLQVLSGSS